MSDFQKLSGLWLNEGRKGKYMSGKLRDEVVIPAGSKFFIFKNDKKRNDKDCDYTLSFAPPDDAPLPSSSRHESAEESQEEGHDIPF